MSVLEQSQRKRWPCGLDVVMLMLMLVIVVTGVAASVCTAAAPTVVTTNLCADWLALSLVDSEQLLAVSYQSVDPSLSPVTEQARRFPVNRGSVEEVLLLKPDRVVASLAWGGLRLQHVLDAQGIDVVVMPYPSNWQETLLTTAQMATVLGQTARGQALVADVAARMEALRDSLPPFRILYLRPNGGSAGAKTYIDEVFSLLGLRNYAKEQGHVGWGRFPLERLVAATPDVFLLGYFDRAMPRSKSGYARHPILKQLLERVPTISVPAHYWGFGGWQLVETAEYIAERVNALSIPADLSAHE